MPSCPVAVVSPHLDDAVMSCGYLLARSPRRVVITVFAGLPEPIPRLQPWDADCGFTSSEEAVSARHQEDDAALAVLSSEALRLPFADGQYGTKYEDVEICDAVAQALAGAADGPVAVPLGLFHDDHVQTSRAAVRACRSQGRRTLLYEDVPYRRLPGAVRSRVEALTGGGLELRGPDIFGPSSERDAERKRHAVNCYRSQVRGLRSAGRLGIADAFTAEAYWEVTGYT